jgi:hypothetical protein
MEKMQSTPFRPWLAELQLAGITFVIAAIAAAFVWLFPASELRIYGINIAVTFAVGTFILVRRTRRRVHGQASEARALRRLENLLGGGWTLHNNVMLPLGDLDGLLSGPDGHRFALEIKSKSSLKILKGTLWRKDKLVDIKGRPIDPKMLEQTRNNAFQVVAHPVLWFPDAKEQAFSSDIEQVIVVCGPSAHLLKVLGIPKKSWWSK